MEQKSLGPVPNHVTHLSAPVAGPVCGVCMLSPSPLSFVPLARTTSPSVRAPHWPQNRETRSTRPVHTRSRLGIVPEHVPYSIHSKFPSQASQPRGSPPDARCLTGSLAHWLTGSGRASRSRDRPSRAARMPKSPGPPQDPLSGDRRNGNGFPFRPTGGGERLGYEMQVIAARPGVTASYNHWDQTDRPPHLFSPPPSAHSSLAGLAKTRCLSSTKISSSQRRHRQRHPLGTPHRILFGSF